MKPSELSNIIKLGENEQVEFKSSFNDETIESLVAFANTKGGTVIIGVNDDGIITGVNVGKETIPKWINEIKQKTQPAIIPDIEVVAIKEYNTIVIKVSEFPVKPLSFKGRYFKRIKHTNHQLNTNEITNLNLQSLQLSWDAYTAIGKTINNLDKHKIQQFIDKVNKSGRFNLGNDWKKSLIKLKLISANTITNAALLLFGKEENQYNIHLGRFKTATTIIDDKIINGTLFEVVEETMKYLLSHIKVAFEITGKTTQRTEIFEYPLPALREIVLNAIIHRDYLSPIDTQIKIFDNQLSFFNPGTLYGNLSIEELKKDHYQAHTRNKLIAEAFYLTGDIEKYGTGLLRIRNEIKEYRTMKFQLQEIANGFKATLLYTNQKTDKVTDKVTDKQLAILKLITQNNHITTSELAVKVDISQRKIKENIAKLKVAGLLERVGPAKGGYWKTLN